MNKMIKKTAFIICLAALPLLSTAQIAWQNTTYNENVNVNKVYCANNDSVFALSNGVGLFCTANKGNTWTAMNNGITNNNLFCMLKTSYGKYFTGSTGYTFFSSPDATNWNQGVMNGTGISISDFNESENGWLYAGQLADGIFRSNDSGATWTEFGFCCDGVRCVYSLGDSLLYAGTNAKGLYHSSTNGSNWKTLNTGLKSKRINDVIFCNTIFYCATDSGLFNSDNLGAQWTPIQALNNQKVNTIYADNQGNLFAGTETNGVYVLRKNNLYWTQEISGLSSLKILSISSDSSNTIYLSTGDSSIFRSAEAFNGIANNQLSHIEINFFPNPSNSQITISIELIQESNAIIEIYTIDGKKCAELFSGNLPAGKTDFKWNTELSGTFLCTVNTQKNQFSKVFSVQR